MLPTPSTSHVSYDRIYEPAEDSFFLIDTISSHTESNFLKKRFSSTVVSPSHADLPRDPQSADPASGSQATVTKPSPLIVEVGTGSGVVLAFLTAHATAIFGRSDVLAIGTDINHFAASAAAKTVRLACSDALANWPTHLPTPCPSPRTASSAPTPENPTHGTLLATLTASLTTPFRPGTISLLLFNPPYVPSEFLPPPPPHSPTSSTHLTKPLASDPPVAEQASHFLSLATDGGRHGMEVTWRFLAEMRRVLDPERGVAYLLLCKANRPEAVMEAVKGWNGEETERGGGYVWDVEMVAKSGYVAGWEKLCVLRIFRECACMDNAYGISARTAT